MIASPLRRLQTRRRIENLRHMRRLVTQEIIHALERLRFQKSERKWPAQFASEAEWRAWCEQDRKDELGELMQCEQEFELGTARFEAAHEVDVVAAPARRAA